jgi:tetratricopeptide (TPR) repeat protein
MAEDVIGYERLIQAEPESPSLHDDVAMVYLGLNRVDAAVRHFRISVGLQPQSAAAHFNLGTALTVAGDLEGAASEFKGALELKPDDAPAHNNLGGLLLRIGRVNEAVTHFESAIRIDSAHANAHLNLGTARQKQGRVGDAIAHYKRAVQLNDDWLPALTGLAWLLAATREDGLREPALSVQLAERAVELTGRQDPVALDVLGAAYAAAGHFNRAIDTAEAAIGLAPPNATVIRERRDLYILQRPYRLGR